MVDQISVELEADRNSVLRSIGGKTFDDALEHLAMLLSKEKVHAKRLVLLSAKSWVLRNKLHAALHDPFITSLDEVENVTIFDEVDEDAESELDEITSIFEDQVKMVTLKDTSLDGHKITKGSVFKVSPEKASKLISEGKAERA
jgi:hypothetical protein